MNDRTKRSDSSLARQLDSESDDVFTMKELWEIKCLEMKIKFLKHYAQDDKIIRIISSLLFLLFYLHLSV